MLNWYDWIMLVVAIIIIVLCLLQGGKSEGASGAVTGGGLNVFVKTKERGSEKVIGRRQSVARWRTGSCKQII